MTASRASQPGIAPAANTTFSAPEPREAWNAGERAHVADVQERRILVVAPQPFYQDRGTPIAVRQVLEALSELGYPVDLLTFPVGLDVEIPGLEIIRAPNPFGIRRVPIGFSPRRSCSISDSTPRSGVSSVADRTRAFMPSRRRHSLPSPLRGAAVYQFSTTCSRASPSSLHSGPDSDSSRSIRY